MLCITDGSSPEPSLSLSMPTDINVLQHLNNSSIFSLVHFYVVVRVRFEQPSYSVREDVIEAEVCLIKEPLTAGPVTIDNVQTVDGTATGK